MIVDRYTRCDMDRFMSFVDKRDSGCWWWTGAKTAGYGNFHVAAVVPDNTTKRQRRTVRSHRWLYERLFGPVAAGMELHHTCNNRSCVNPDHLTPMNRHDHAWLTVPPPADHCQSGHLRTRENAYLRPDGNFDCRVCARERARRRKAVAR